MAGSWKAPRPDRHGGGLREGLRSWLLPNFLCLSPLPILPGAWSVKYMWSHIACGQSGGSRGSMALQFLPTAQAVPRCLEYTQCLALGLFYWLCHCVPFTTPSGGCALSGKRGRKGSWHSDLLVASIHSKLYVMESNFLLVLWVFTLPTQHTFSNSCAAYWSFKFFAAIFLGFQTGFPLLHHPHPQVQLKL